MHLFYGDYLTWSFPKIEVYPPNPAVLDGILHYEATIVGDPPHSRKPPHNNWLVVSPPLKNMKVNWDDEIPNRWKNISHVPVTTNQKIAQFQIAQVSCLRLKIQDDAPKEPSQGM